MMAAVDNPGVSRIFSTSPKPSMLGMCMSVKINW